MLKSALVVLVIAVAIVQHINAGILLKNKYEGVLNTGLRTMYGDHVMKANARDAPAQWFTQNVDHFDPQNADTYQQKYYVNDTYYRAGGPVFFMLGGEGPLSPSSVAGYFILNHYAQIFNGFIVALEHRFYGESMPKPDLSTESLKFLSSQQALADAAVFRQYLAQKYRFSNDTKFIVVGGSYSGNLAAWARSKYPHLFDISLGTSGPVLAVENFPEYMDVVADSLGPSCNSRVRQATDVIERMLQTPEGIQQLQQRFKTCSPIRSNDDVVTFLSSLTEGICNTVQYNIDNNSVGRVWNISAICSVIESGNDALASFSNFVSYYQSVVGEQCTLASYDDYISMLKDIRPYPANENAAGRSWTYQTCTEFGYYQSAQGRKQPFSEKITIQWFVQQCEQIFGIKGMRPNIDFTNAYYGARNVYTTKTFLPNGSIDPWHALGITSNPVGPETYTFFMQGTAHCADLYAPRDSDLPTLTNTRAQILNKLSQWLNEKK